MKKFSLLAIIAALVALAAGCGSFERPDPNATMVIQTPYGPRLAPNPLYGAEMDDILKNGGTVVTPRDGHPTTITMDPLRSTK